MIPEGIRERLANWREGELNPVVVKELRQAVRSWAVTGTLLLLLSILFCVSIGFLLTQGTGPEINPNLGADMFQAFLFILTGLSMLFIPLYVGTRVAAERQESNVDLLYVSTLSPGRIIRGKFMSGAYMAALFFSACMPFMTFTNLLRGVDLPTVFLILLFLFLIVCAAIQAAIFVGCLPLGRGMKIGFAVFGASVIFSMISPMIFFYITLMRAGLGSMFLGGGQRFWAVLIAYLGFGATGVGLLYFLSVALVSPASANRALPVRIYTTGAWVVAGIGCISWGWMDGNISHVVGWSVATLTVLSIALIVVISNHDRLSLRVQSAIPASPLRRWLAFPFFNGAAGGLAWAAILGLLTFAVITLALGWTAAAAHTTPWRVSSSDRFDLKCGGVLIYFFDYALTALFIHRRFLGRRPPKLAGVIMVLLPVVLAVVPGIFLFFFNRLTWESLQRLQLGNAFNLMSTDNNGEISSHLILGGSWLVLCLALNTAWFLRQLQEFRPPAPRPPVILETPGAGSP